MPCASTVQLHLDTMGTFRTLMPRAVPQPPTPRLHAPRIQPPRLHAPQLPRAPASPVPQSPRTPTPRAQWYPLSSCTKVRVGGCLIRQTSDRVKGPSCWSLEEGLTSGLASHAFVSLARAGAAGWALWGGCRRKGPAPRPQLRTLQPPCPRVG